MLDLPQAARYSGGLQRIFIMRFSAVFALVCMTALPAQAQNLEWQDFDISAGGSVQYRPDYLGSDDYDVGFTPNLEASWQHVLFLSARNGAGVYLVDYPASRFGVSIMPDFGRDDSSNSRLNGLGDIGFGWNVKIFGEMNYEPFIAGAVGTLAVGGDAQGQTVAGYAGFREPLNEKLTSEVTLGTTWASATWGRAYYGVTTAQAVASGLPVHGVSSGLRDASLTGKLTYALSPQLSMTGTARWSRLLGDVAESPIVAEKDALMLGMGLDYKFATATRDPGNN